MPNPLKTAVPDNRTPCDWVPLTLSSDVDLTDPEGPTGGNMARALFVVGAGNLVFLAGGAPNLTPAARTLAVPANFQLSGIVQKVYMTSTATGVWALL